MKKFILIIAGILLIAAGYAIGNFYPFSIFNEKENEVKTGILEGKVSIGPLCPVEPCSGTIPNPYISRMIVIKQLTGELLFNIPLAEDGSFEMEIAAGTYALDLSDCTFLGCRYSLPKTIKIGDNKTTEINIDIDTGIR